MAVLLSFLPPTNQAKVQVIKIIVILVFDKPRIASCDFHPIHFNKIFVGFHPYL